MFCVRLLRLPARQVIDWWITFAVVAAMSALGFFLWTPHAGWIAFGALIALILAPLRIDRAAQRLSRAGHDKRALAAARFAALLHPLGAIGARPRALEALARIRATGEVDEQTLARLGAGDDPVVAEWYRLLALNAAGNAAAVRAALAIPSRRLRMLQHGVGAIFVRAVAMTGTRGEIIEAVEDAERHDATLDDPERRAILALEACAGLGDVEATRQLGADLAQRLPRGAVERAIAAAQLAAGDDLGARATISKTLARGDLDPAARRAIEKLRGRFDIPREPPNAAIDARARALIERLRHEAAAAQALAPLVDFTVFNAWVTWSLAAAMVGWFLVIAAYGSTTDPRDLETMGGLLLPIEDALGAVRLFTSTFVHYGLPHLLFNTYALLVFGRFVESFYGRGRMLAIWIAATLTSGLGVAAMAVSKQTLVGASGAIFGLGGALVSAVALREDLRKSRRGREELRGFGALVALQFVFDRLVPGVSGTAHIAGLLGGALAGAILVPRRR